MKIPAPGGQIISGRVRPFVETDPVQSVRENAGI